MTTAIALAADYTNLLQLLESSDELTPEMITDTLEGIEGELADKRDAIMVIARNNLGHAKTCDEEIKRLAERKKSRTRTVSRRHTSRGPSPPQRRGAP